MILADIGYLFLRRIFENSELVIEEKNEAVYLLANWR